MALQKNSCEFDIPFDRQQLADYLNLERTGMSKELGRMKREGLVEFRKNHFRKEILKAGDRNRLADRTAGNIKLLIFFKIFFCFV